MTNPSLLVHHWPSKQHASLMMTGSETYEKGASWTVGAAKLVSMMNKDVGADFDHRCHWGLHCCRPDYYQRAFRFPQFGEVAVMDGRKTTLGVNAADTALIANNLQSSFVGPVK